MGGARHKIFILFCNFRKIDDEGKFEDATSYHIPPQSENDANIFFINIFTILMTFCVVTELINSHSDSKFSKNKKCLHRHHI